MLPLADSDLYQCAWCYQWVGMSVVACGSENGSTSESSYRGGISLFLLSVCLVVYFMSTDLRKATFVFCFGEGMTTFVFIKVQSDVISKKTLEKIAWTATECMPLNCAHVVCKGYSCQWQHKVRQATIELRK